MSYCKEEGKDKVIFLVAEDLAAPSTVTLPADEDPPGLILPSGEINWSCPCLGGMAVGPCGVEFREAFSCFHFSKEDSKGSDCFDKFKSMQECMKNYPTVYGKDEDRVEEEREEARAESGEEARTAEEARPSS